MTYNICIIKNETDDDHLPWVTACKNNSEDIKYKIVDITRNDWLDRVQEENFDIYLVRPPDKISFFKQLYDERLYILHNILMKNIYPSFEETLVYENKKFLSYWLRANQIPHPFTGVFYYKNEVLSFIETCKLPIVAKTSIGAGGSGVRIIKDRKELSEYVQQAFSEKGITRRWGVNLRKGSYVKRLFNRMIDIPGFFSYLSNKRRSASIDPHRWFVIFQEYIPVVFEWRVVRIGDSFFAHKKLGEKDGLISGTSKVSWDGPDDKLLNFVKMVTDKREFLSQAVDIFVDLDGSYLVNELQCFFGSKAAHQMILNGKPGRYIHNNSAWIFEEGEFNLNNSYNLRLENALSIFNAGLPKK